ncbi:MAG: CDP-diacylglycerol--serine O-phosphatidyltransferase [Candidatus Omnitrophica bacterium]|nr:CDP-diacylglycerol--serine O-phosphatidyltransferase [Candidatus Omnitrophota bacterium]
MTSILYSLPNILTCCNILAGLCAIYLSICGKINFACWLVLASAFFDGLDGWAARRLDRESSFGRIFDSVADFISFGCAPVFIYYAMAQAKDLSGLPVMLIYILASAIRLVRFTMNGDTDQGRDFEGLPTTASALLLVSLFFFFPQNFSKPAFSAPLFIGLSALMLSRIRFWKFNR